MIECLLEHVGSEPGNLPLLEFALKELWNERDSNVITHAAYEKIGQVSGSLAQYADMQYAKLSEAHQEQAHAIFLKLVQPGQRTLDSRRSASKAEIGDDKWHLVTTLANARLLVTSKNVEGEEIVEVIHEALIWSWERLQAWVNLDREFLTWQKQLRHDCQQWIEADQHEGALLHGFALDKAKVWYSQRTIDLAPAEIDFIQSSVIKQEQEIAVRKAQLKREKRLIYSRKLIIVAALTILLTALWFLRSQFLLPLCQQGLCAGRPLNGVDWSGESLHSVELNGANLRNASLRNADLRNADLRNADLYFANLSGAKLSRADLRGAFLSGVNLRDVALLNGADLSNAYLNGANLRDAILSEAKLNGAILHDAFLLGADLRRANLSEADLAGANLHNAFLFGVNLQGTKYNSQTIWPENFNPIDFGAVKEE